MIVPVVPMLLTKWVTVPPVCSQISGPVPVDVGLGIVRVGKLVEDDPAPFVAHRSGHVAGQFHAPSFGVSTSSAPKARMVWRRSTLWFSGITRNHGVAADGGSHRQRDAGVSWSPR